MRAPIGGIFRNVLDLAAEQSARGHLVGIILDSTTGGAFEADKIAAAAPHLALGVVRLPMSRSIRPSDLVSAWRVYRIVRDLAPDVLHGHGAKGGTFARLVGSAIARSGRPVARLYTPHGGSLHFSKTSLPGRIVHGLERLLEHSCDALIHVSRFEADAYVEKVGRPRCPATVIANGLRPEEFAVVEPDDAASDLLFMGMMRDLKGPDVLIRAVAELRRRTGRAPTLAMLGDGPDLEAMKALVAALELEASVTFHGPKPTREGFRMGRLMIVPSRAESMPYIVLESVAAGLPLVASRVGGIPEILGPRARDLVEPENVMALADAIEAALADPAASRARAMAARRTLRERYTVSAMTDGVERLYLGALAQRRTGMAPVLLPSLQPAE